MTAGELVPVTVIGGYLGAGKTTLVNRLLAAEHGRRLAVLVNDFGAVNIDAELITAHDGDTISLQNGCVCCSIADALGEALDRVLALHPRPDQVVIEASGVADPAKVAMYGQGWPGCRLDAVLVLADAETIRARAGDRFVGELVTRQLGGGDVVLLTKCDLLADDAAVAAVAEWAQQVAVGVPILEVHNGEIDPAIVLDPVPGAARAAAQSGAPAPAAVPAIDPEQLFDSAALQLVAPLDHAALEAALRDWPDEVLRVKGVVAVTFRGADAGRSGLQVVQRVGRRWSIEALTPATPATGADGADGAGQLSLISRRGETSAAAWLARLTDRKA